MTSELQKVADLHLIAKVLEPKEYPLQGLKSMKEKSLTEHTAVLYKGYVDNYNRIVQLIRKTKP